MDLFPHIIVKLQTYDSGVAQKYAQNLPVFRLYAVGIQKAAAAAAAAAKGAAVRRGSQNQLPVQATDFFVAQQQLLRLRDFIEKLEAVLQDLQEDTKKSGSARTQAPAQCYTAAAQASASCRKGSLWLPHAHACFSPHAFSFAASLPLCSTACCHPAVFPRRQELFFICCWCCCCCCRLWRDTRSVSGLPAEQ